MIRVHAFGEGAHVVQAMRRYAGVPGVVTRVYADADLDEFPNLADIDPARILLLELVTWDPSPLGGVVRKTFGHSEQECYPAGNEEPHGGVNAWGQDQADVTGSTGTD
jgi:hypothetical protein